MLDKNGNFVLCKCGKRCYTEKEAGFVINRKDRTSRSRKSRTGDIPKRKYYCEECGYYHVSHSINTRKYKWYKTKKHKNNLLTSYEVANDEIIQY